jgi:uracil-DNA glycosylase family 4
MSSQTANGLQIEGNIAVDQPGGARVKGGQVERADEQLTAAEMASVLQWWLDAGVDVPVAEDPRDWLKPKPVELPAPMASAGVTPPAVQAPREEALPGQLNLFQAWLQSSDALPFAAPAAPRVCPAGDPASGLMIMIDMPTAEDCASGTLLAGEVGTLFDRMLAAIGRDRSSVYFAAISCFRSADGRIAGPQEKQCGLIARHHIGLAQPRALLLFGEAAARALLGLPLAHARGRWHEIATHAGPVRALATFAPRWLLENPAQKGHAWRDLQMLMEGLKQ